ncbi:hypothetical protein WIS52_20825 [Pseudonocardia nematodicida]|uniref:Uncharacterized protein n=1 Tax=Pseudonocardia nematodicida TaxID=1206997 RepID=A0ABV1KEN7_9PSEU
MTHPDEQIANNRRFADTDAKDHVPQIPSVGEQAGLHRHLHRSAGRSADVFGLSFVAAGQGGLLPATTRRDIAPLAAALNVVIDRAPGTRSRGGRHG